MEPVRRVKNDLCHRVGCYAVEFIAVNFPEDFRSQRKFGSRSEAGWIYRATGIPIVDIANWSAVTGNRGWVFEELTF